MNKKLIYNSIRIIGSSNEIKKIIDSYFTELLNRKAHPNKIALDLSNSKVLVWAEIKTDDEKTEDALILAAAKVNYEFSEYGFHISTTIVEEEDGLEVPKHYIGVLN